MNGVVHGEEHIPISRDERRSCTNEQVVKEDSKWEVVGIVRAQSYTQATQIAEFQRQLWMRKVHLSTVVRLRLSKSRIDLKVGMGMEGKVNDMSMRMRRGRRGWG